MKSIFLGLVLYCNLSALIDPSKDLLVNAAPSNNERHHSKIQIFNPVTFDKKLEINGISSCPQEFPLYLFYFYNPTRHCYEILTPHAHHFACYSVENGTVTTSYPACLGLINVMSVIQKDGNPSSVLVGDRSGVVSEYDTSGAKIRDMCGAQYSSGTYGINCFAMYQNLGKISLISGSCDGTIFIRNYQDNKLEKILNAGQPVTSLVIFEDQTGINLVAGTSNIFNHNSNVGQLICWNLTTWQERYRMRYDSQGFNSLQEHTPQWGWIKGLIVLRDIQSDCPFKLITIANDSGIKIWNAQTGECIRTLCKEFDGNVLPLHRCVSVIKPFRVNDQIKFFAGYYNGDIAFWDIHDGLCESTSKIVGSRLVRSAVVYEYDGKLYASANSDSGYIRTWSLSNYACVEQVQVNNGINFCVATNQNDLDQSFHLMSSHDSVTGLGSNIRLFNLDNLYMPTIV